MDDVEAPPELADVENDAPKNFGEEPVARKPGSKGQRRKRTKTGCLSKYFMQPKFCGITR